MLVALLSHARPAALATGRFPPIVGLASGPLNEGGAAALPPLPCPCGMGGMGWGMGTEGGGGVTPSLRRYNGGGGG